jgi:hypothetical protein
MFLQVDDVDALIDDFSAGFKPGGSAFTVLRRYGMFDAFNPPGDGTVAGLLPALCGGVWECGRGCWMLCVRCCLAPR